MSAAPLRVALGEYDTGWHDPAASLERAARVVGDAAAAGAGLVMLPEMCATGFTMESERWAEAIDGPSARRLGELAREHGVHLLAGLATREGAGAQARFYNSALLFSPAGELAAEYRKQRLFAFAGEHGHYAPGAEPRVVEIAGVRVAPFICYDLRFPELFRAVAPRVDALLLIANWPASRRPHWDALLPARAIENQCAFVAVNRTGQGGGLEYDGGSAAFGPWGERLPEHRGAVRCVELDPARVARVRAEYPFLADLREPPAR